VKGVCWNTVRLALNQALAKIEIRHFTGFEEKLNFKVQTLAQMGQINQYTQQLFNGLADVKLTTNDIKNALNAVYPKPVVPASNDSKEVKEFERMLQRAEQAQKMSKGLLENYNEDFPELANTAWGLWNGITEFENHFNKNDAQSVVFGSAAGVMQDALNVLVNRSY
jgi:hypothetical protein